MKLDLELLFTNLSRTEEDTGVSRDGVNDYLIDKILFSCMNGERIFLKDIDFSAFDAEDVEELERFYDRMTAPVHQLEKVVTAMRTVDPVAASSRKFC